jgi:thioredoxin-related protein
MDKKINIVRLLLLAMLMSAPNLLIAQGIEFFHGTFEEAKTKAKLENKPLFIDVYTSWCGPCKMMAKKVFTQKEVGTYFNQNFICYKLQADDKEGKNRKIAYSYHVVAYPTLLWIDGKGELLHVAVGYQESDELIGEAKIVFDEDKRVGGAISKWNKGDRSFEVAKKYFAFDRNSKGEFNDFFNNLTEEQKLDSLTFSILTEVRLDTNSEVFKYVVKHRKDYQKIAYSFEISRTIDEKVEWDFETNYGTDKFETTINKYKKLGLEEAELYAKRVEYRSFLKESDFAGFEKSSNEFIEKFSDNYPDIYGTLIFDLYETDRTNFSVYSNPGRILEWIKVVKKQKKGASFEELLAYAIVGDKEKAKSVGKEIIDSLKGQAGAEPYVDYVEMVLGTIN